MPDMLVKLYDLPPMSPPPAGVTIRPARSYEKHPVITWVRERFDQAWADQAEVGFMRTPVSCLVAERDGELLGFACYDATCLNYFGPTGVDESARGRGIGRALLFATLRAMWDHGYAYAVIGAAGPTKFYESQCGAVAIEGSTPGVYRGRIH